MARRRISIRLVAVSLGLLTTGVGCRFNTGGLSGPPDGPRESKTPGREVALADRPMLDAPTSDGPTSDGLPNGAKTDQSRPLDVGPADQKPTADQKPKADLPKPDQKPKADLPKPDQKPKADLPKPDQKPKADLPKPDQKPKADLPKPDLPAPPCAKGGPAFTFQADMVICSGPSSNQCSAAAACNAASGWHLCTATEYLARGGKTAPPPGTAWLASCIRSGALPYAPTDAICPGCSKAVTSMASVEWTCPPNTATVTNATYVGVVAESGCHRVGVNALQNEAAWSMSFAATTRTQSVCCR